MPKRREEVVKKKQKKPQSDFGKAMSWVFPLIGRVILTIFLVMIITGSIVTVTLSAIILRMVDTSPAISIDGEELSYTSSIMARNAESGEFEEIQRVYGDENSIWADAKIIPQHMKDAAVAVEDKRFYEHAGVDWKRTAAAAVNMFIPILPGMQGGSTLDQQLVKNITGEKDPNVTRKVQEIFSAIALDKTYPKDDILVAYLNTMRLGNNTRGVQAAANFYFGKDVSQLTLVECASIVGITKNPTKYDPIRRPDDNKERRDHILKEMYDQGFITLEEKEAAQASELDLDLNEGAEAGAKIQSYYTDAVMEEAISIIMTKEGVTRAQASEKFLEGGFVVHTALNQKVQNEMTAMYLNEYDTLFRTAISNKPVQSAAVLLHAQTGAVQAITGGVGEKSSNRGWNRATMTKRHPGSTMKPVSIYTLGIERNIVTYSSMFVDKPISYNDGGTIWSPTNYYPGHRGKMTVDMAIRASVNTVAVQVEEKVGPRESFDFMYNELKVESLVESRTNENGLTYSDIALSPMSLGALTEGVTPLEWAGAYEMFTNGGNFIKPYFIERIYTSKGDLYYEVDATPVRVIGEDTAFIMNKLLQNVVYEAGGTGAYAKAVPTRVAAKTGTSNDNKDLWFVGGTADYTLAVWIGHDTPKPINYNAPYTPVLTWTELMKRIEAAAPTQSTFPKTDSVVELKYCSVTGEEARDTCPEGGVGVYRKAGKPPLCTGHNIFDESFTIDEDGQRRDSEGHVVDGDGNRIDEDGNITMTREEVLAMNNPDNLGDDDDDEESSTAPPDNGGGEQSSTESSGGTGWWERD